MKKRTDKTEDRLQSHYRVPAYRVHFTIIIPNRSLCFRIVLNVLSMSKSIVLFIIISVPSVLFYF